jgi:hypothetical protein
MFDNKFFSQMYNDKLHQVTFDIITDQFSFNFILAYYDLN